MGESTLKTLDDIMFVQGETPLNQENWQAYFGGVLPNGIYEGFAPRTNYQGETVNGITAGVAVYNGLVYRMADGIAVDRDVPESNGYRLISLRIYPDTGVAKIVETRGNAPVSSDETILNGIIQMTQNPVVSGRDSDQNSYVDYRLCYQGHKNSLYRAGVDLRQPALMRNGKFPNGWSIYWNNYKPSTGNIILSGNMVYNWVAPRTDWSLSVWLDPMNPPDNAKVVTNAHYVTFHEYPAIVDVTRSGDHPDFIYGMKDEFRNVIDCFGTNWERRTQPGAGHIYNDPVVWEYHDATPETPFVVQYRGKNGNQNMFLIQMPTNGSSTEWGLVEGTLSNQTDLQEALDAKADATAVYTKTEADTLIYSKAETDALLDEKADAADVYAKTETYTKTETDVLLDAKANASDVYTKSDTDEIVSAFYSKQETDALLDAKADSADVYDKTETYSKTETDVLLDEKANSADVYDKTETYSKTEVDEQIYSKAETDALLDEKADAADVYDKTKIYTKTEVDSALGGKANSSSVYTKSQIDTKLGTKEDKSALGSFAYKNSLSYDSLTNKPTLGTLAGKNKVSLSSDVTDILPVSKGGTGVSTSPSLNVNLAINKTANVFLDTEVGVTGVLPINKGGTGLTNTSGLVTNLEKSGVGTLFLENEIGVKGVLPISKGGTGMNSAPSIMANLASGLNGNPLAENGEIGVTGILPTSNGGTGKNLTRSPQAIVYLEKNETTDLFVANPTLGVYGVLPTSRGGTGTADITNLYKAVHDYIKSVGGKIYVSTSGSDTKDGSEGNPVRTIAKAIELIGDRVEGNIEIASGTYYEDALTFNKASRYIIIGHGARIIPSNFTVIRSSMHIFGDLRISTNVNLQDDGKIIAGQSGFEGTLTVDGYINAHFSTCYLNNVVCNNSNGSALNCHGGLIIYKSLSGNYQSVGNATQGGIISTGDGHIFS